VHNPGQCQLVERAFLLLINFLLLARYFYLEKIVISKNILRGSFLFWSNNCQKDFNSTIQLKNSMILQKFATGKFQIFTIVCNFTPKKGEKYQECIHSSLLTLISILLNFQ